MNVSELSEGYNEYNSKVLGDLLQEVALRAGTPFAEELLSIILKKDTPQLEQILRVRRKDNPTMMPDMRSYNQLLDNIKYSYDLAQRYNSQVTFDKCDDCSVVDPTVKYRDTLQRYLCDDCYSKTVTPTSYIKPAVLRGIQMYSGGRTIELPEDYYPFDGVEED